MQARSSRWESLKTFVFEYWHVLVLILLVLLGFFVLALYQEIRSLHDIDLLTWHATGQALWESVHYSVPTIIVGMELYMLYQISKEKKERQDTTNALRSFQAAMGRQNYLEQIVNSIYSAKNDIVFTTATMEASWYSREQKSILDAVKKRCPLKPKTASSNSPAETASFKHRGIVAIRPETLPGVVELLSLTGVELKMQHVMNMSKLRFLVQDNERCVLGVADSFQFHKPHKLDGDMSLVEPTRLSFSLDSRMLALALRKQFEELWEQSIKAWDFIDESIKNARPVEDPHTQLSILNWLRVERSIRKIVHEKLKENCPSYQAMAEIDPTELSQTE